MVLYVGTNSRHILKAKYVIDCPEEGSGHPWSTIPGSNWNRGWQSRGGIAVLGLSSPKVIGFASNAFGRACLVLSGARDDSEGRHGRRGSATATIPVRRLRRKQAPCHGGLTRAGAQPEGRAPESGGRTPDAPSCCGCGAVAVAVVTARRAGTLRRCGGGGGERTR